MSRGTNRVRNTTPPNGCGHSPRIDRPGNAKLYAVLMWAIHDTEPHRSSVVLIEAVSQDEARGKGMRVARKAWPAWRQFYGHGVYVCPSTTPIDPDGPITFTPIE